MSVYFFIELAVILAVSKLLGYITKNLHMTSVVGALLSGIILGPSILGYIDETEFIVQASQLGVVVLMFNAGLETDVRELRRCGKASFIIALLGVMFPLAAGYLICKNVFYLNEFQSLFIGVVLTSTSVSITAETLQELGKIQTSSATAIMGACVIDDILGIILLSIISSLSQETGNSFHIFGTIALFIIFALAMIKILPYIFERLSKNELHKKRMPLYSFLLCLLLAFISERYFHIASIIGAYLGGIVVSSTEEASNIRRKIGFLSYLLLSPIFFASVGIKIKLTSFSPMLISFTALLLIIAVLTKVIGCGIGGLVTGYSFKDSFCIGTGMISRGEVALIVTNLGISAGLLSNQLFSPVVLVVLITTLITPILLSYAYK